MAEHRAFDVELAFYRKTTDVSNPIARLNANRIRWALTLDGFHDKSLRVTGFCHDAMTRFVDALDREQCRHDIERPVDRNCKSNALRAGPHSHIDADHLAVDI